MNLRKVSAELDGPLILHFTVQLAPGRQIDSIANQPIVVEIDGRPVSVRRDGDSLLFKVPDITSTEEGRAWMARIWRGVQYVTVRSGVSFKANFNLQDVDIADGWRSNPGQLKNPLGIQSEVGRDGALDGSRPYLAPADATYWKFSMGTPTVVVGTKLETFLAALVEGASKTPANELPVQLETALQLFASAELEQQSARPRLLTYVMAIEALAHPPKPKHPVIVDLLRGLRADIDQALARPALDESARASLDALRNELDFRHKSSIRASVFLFINALANLAGRPTGEATSRRKRFDAVYDVRGALAHSGTAADEEVGSAVGAARELCTALLADVLEFGLPDGLV